MKEETLERVEPPAVRAALDKILASEGFAVGRLGPFLRHIVEASLRGASGDLKEAVLGMEVFGRTAGYDVRSDSIVRVEARRLRERLAEYYAGPGAKDSVRIEIPKGAYTAVFHQVQKDLPPIGPPRRWVTAAALLGAGAAAVAGSWAVYQRSKPQSPPLRRVLVLPFANLGGDDDYFADGLTEEVIDRLGRMQGVQVVSRGVAVAWRGKDPRQAASSLGCTAVVDGSVRRNGDRVRIVARLIQAQDGVQLWSESFDRDGKDVLAVHEEMAQSVAAVLRVEMGSAGRGTQSFEALQNFFRGRHAANGHSLSGLKEAMGYLELAVQQDPEFALAWARLAAVYAVLGFYALLADSQAWPRAVECAKRALALDAGLPDAHAALGMVYGVHDWNWQRAQASLAEALRLGPESASANSLAAIAYLMPVCKYAEANDRFQRAAELEPQSVFNSMGWAFNLLSSGAYPEAIRIYEQVLRLQPQMPDLFSDYGMALGLAGRHAEAEVQFQAWMRLKGRTRLDEVALFFCGKPELARKSASSYGDSPMDKARLWALLGEKEKSCGYLDQARNSRDRQFFLVKADPRLRSLRGYARYEQIVRQVGL